MALCSESERWRAQAAIQLTLGAITGSKAVVLDRADLLDAGNRAGLVCAVNRVAERTGMAVLLCSTGTPAADAPWTQIQVAGRGGGMRKRIPAPPVWLSVGILLGGMATHAGWFFLFAKAVRLCE